MNNIGENGTIKLISKRETLGFSLGGIAVLLRMSSDWLFSTGGPFPYQLAQAIFLFLGLIMVWPRLDSVYLQGGQTLRSVLEGLLAIPLGLLTGLYEAWTTLGRLAWPTLIQAVVPIGNNLFFPAVEELEFRGFLLAWLLRRKVTPTKAIWIVAILHMFAHVHRLWQGNYIGLVWVAIMGIWWGGLTCRTRSLWGAYVAHALFNIFVLLPILGSGINVR